MPDLNNVTLCGRLTRDPEVRHVGSSNTALCNISIALDQGYKNSSGEKVDKTSFIDCKLWGASGEALARFLKKGEPVIVCGELEQETWEDNDGGRRSKVVVKVNNWHFVPSKPGAGGGQKAGGGPSEPDIPF